MKKKVVSGQSEFSCLIILYDFYNFQFEQFLINIWKIYKENLLRIRLFLKFLIKGL